jgi:predicted DNA binding CopG/RHH family protein
MKKINLSKLEKSIEDQADEYRPASEKKKKKVEKIVDKVNKTRSITFRMKEDDLNQIRQQAQKEGLPYQTFITSVLHKFVTKQLIEKTKIKEAVRLLKDS